MHVVCAILEMRVKPLKNTKRKESKKMRLENLEVLTLLVVQRESERKQGKAFLKLQTRIVSGSGSGSGSGFGSYVIHH